MAVLNQRQKKHNGRFYNVAVFLYLLHMVVMANLTMYYPDTLMRFRLPSFAIVTALLLLAILLQLQERSFPLSTILSFVGIVAAILCGAAIYDETIPILKAIFLKGYFIKYVFLFSLIFTLEKDPQTRRKQLLVVATVALATYQLGVILEVYGSKNNFEYMTVGYGCAPWWAIVTQGVFSCTKKLSRLVCLALSTYFAGFITLYGNRGALLIILLTIPILVIAYIPRKKKIAFLLFMAAGAVILYSNLGPILQWSGEKLNMNLDNSRNFRLLAHDRLTYDSGRFPIYKAVLDTLEENPLLARGIGADRLLTPSGSYVHNIVLELCVDFGVIIGLLLYSWLLYIGFYMFIRCKSREWRALFLPFYCYSMIELFLSGSLWESGYLFAAIAVYLRFRCLNREEKALQQAKGDLTFGRQEQAESTI